MFLGLGMRDVASMVAEVAYDVQGKEEEADYLKGRKGGLLADTRSR